MGDAADMERYRQEQATEEELLFPGYRKHREYYLDALERLSEDRNQQEPDDEQK